MKQIIHLADLHIRTGDVSKCRYDEYAQVFDKFINYIKTLVSVTAGEAAIIIAGDLFHHKNKLESVGIKLFLTFIQSLASLAPVYIIRGNHDYKQETPDEPDMIDSLLTVTIPNVTYWRETGHYVIGKDKEIGIGLTAIQNALKSGNTSGITDVLPIFPSPTEFPPSVKHKIALFHGAVSQTRLPSGETMKTHSTYPLEWFDGYDAIMLGDIHLQQVQRAKSHNVLKPTALSVSQDVYMIQKYHYANASTPPFAYAGSMVQQDFGETLLGHGFMIWDMPTKTVTCAHICNDYGLITIKEADDKQDYLVHVKCFEHNAWLPLSQIHSSPWMPKQVAIRVRTNTNDATNEGMLADISSKCQREYGMRIMSINFYTPPQQHQQQQQHNDNTQINECEGDDIIAKCNTPATWISYIEKEKEFEANDVPYWRDWFTNLESLSVPDEAAHELDNMTITTKINDRNDKVQKKIDIYMSKRDETMTASRRKFKLHHIEWDWILCYRDRNWFDFTTLDCSISSINAKNGNGKTSFLETICIALFGEGFPSRTNKQFASSIISQQKPLAATATTQITIGLYNTSGNPDIYKITRGFQPGANNNKLQTTRETLVDRMAVDGTIENMHSGRTAVDNWVESMIGTMDSFLMSCMVTQAGDKDFFSMTSPDQKALLDRAMSLDTHAKYMDIMKESKLAHQAIMDLVASAKAAIIKTSDDNKNNHVTTEMLEEITCELEALQKRKSKQDARRLECIAVCGNESMSDEFFDKQTLEAKVLELNKLDYNNDDDDVDDTIESLDKHLAVLTYTLGNMSPPPRGKENAPALSMMMTKLEAENVVTPPRSREVCENELSMYERWRANCCAGAACTTTSEQFNFKLTKLGKERAKYERQYNEYLTRRAEDKAELDRITARWKEHMSVKPCAPRASREDREKWSINKVRIETEFGSEPMTNIAKLAATYKDQLESLRQSISREEILRLRKYIANANNAGATTQSVEDCEKNCKDARFAIQEIDEDGARYHANLQQLQEDMVTHMMKRTIADVTEEPYTIEAVQQEKTELLASIEYAMSERENMAEYLKTLEKTLQQCSPIMDKIKRLNKEVSDRQHDLDECNGYPFNSDCKACRDAPWKLRIVALVAEKRGELVAVQLELASILAEFDHATVQDAEIEIADVKRNIVMMDRYNVLDWHEHYMTLSMAIGNIKIDITEKRAKFEQITKQLSTLEGELQYNKAIHTIRDYDRTEKQLLDLKQSLEHVELSRRIYQDAAFWQEEETNANAMEAWNIQHDSMDYDMSRLQASIQELSVHCEEHERVLRETHEQLHMIQKQSDDHERYMREREEWKDIASKNPLYLQDWDKIAEIEAVRAAQVYWDVHDRMHRIKSRVSYLQHKHKLDIWETWHELHYVLPEMTKKLDGEILDANKRVSEIRCALEQTRTLKEQINKCDMLINVLYNRIRVMGNITNIMMGFSTWLYCERVLPMLCAHSNKIISVMCGIDRPLTVQAEFSNGVFNWFLKDGPTCPPIEKASGFQRFVCALGMRIALGRVGACGMSPRQLFLDEGFTACDGDNLARVPEFLHNMLELYDSIVIVSHLEELKNCVDKSIPIIRDLKGSSQMQWGPEPQLSQPIPVTVPTTGAAPAKKRGRPPKNPK